MTIEVTGATIAATTAATTVATWRRAEEIVRRAYLSVLRREPDAASRGWVDRVVRENWTQADVERELRRSPEYRDRR